MSDWTKSDYPPEEDPQTSTDQDEVRQDDADKENGRDRQEELRD